MAKATDPIVINKSVLKNRLTFAPTVKFDWAEDDGKVSDKHVEHYRERAEHGLGLICVEATAVTAEGRFDHHHIGIWDDSQIESHRRVTEACHPYGTVVLVQLNHTGIVTNPKIGPSIGPSAVEGRSGMSREMTVDEIHEIEQHYIDAAVRAKKAGYDGIQLHACHGYLINQFACRKTNHRTDEYGGSPENMARFGANIIRGIREACGPDFLISARTVGADPDLKTAAAIAEEYVKAGCDYLQVSAGIEHPDPALHDPSLPYNEICGLGVHFHNIFKGRVPVSCVNGILEPELVHYLLENDLVDTVDLARVILADPAFSEAVLEGKPFVKCFNCPRCQYGPFTKHLCPAAAVREKRSKA